MPPDNPPHRLLVLGGARSGKSAYAGDRARKTGLTRIFLATGEARDDEMRDRIARHRADRGPGWRTIEEPIRIADVLTREARPDTVILVDCLTLWLSNLLLAEMAPRPALDRLLAALRRAQGTIILVANEVGLGIVPENRLARRFRDEAGRINQDVARISDEVQFLAAGLPLRLK